MIFDVLASDITVAGEADFVVPAPGAIDIAVNGVGANGLIFSNAAGFTTFVLGDNLRILKVWPKIYFGFGQGSPVPGTHKIGLAYWDGAAFETMEPFPSPLAAVQFPDVCEPIDCGPEGVYSPMPSAGAKRQIRLSFLQLRASLINVPPDLVGQTINVQYFLSVQHNFIMEP